MQPIPKSQIGENHPNIKPPDIKTPHVNLQNATTQQTQSNVNNLVNNNSYFQDPDIIRNREVVKIVNDAFGPGKLTLKAPLTNSDAIIPPNGIAKYSPEERKRHLHQIAYLKTGYQQEKIGPGCSTLLTLLGDELHESYLVLRRHRLLKNQDEKNVLGDCKANIESLIGLLSNVSRGKFEGKLHSNKIPFEWIQHCIVSSLKAMLTDEGIPDYNFQKNFINSPEANRFFGALKLLEDFVTQEMHRLYMPLADPADLSDHFSRLHRRADCFQRVLSDKEGFDSVEKSLFKKHFGLLNRQNAALIEFCHLITPSLEKLKKKNEHKALAELWIRLESLHLNAEMLNNRSALTYALTIELNKNPNDPDLQFFLRLCMKNTWTYNTLVDESYFVMLINLINDSQTSNLEIDTYIENLIEVSKAIITHKKEDIDTRLKNLPKNKKAELLNSIWQSGFELIRKNTFFPAINQLELRLQHCRNSPTDQSMRALAIRDALNLLGGPVLNSKRQIDQLIKIYQVPLLLDEEKNAEYLKLYQDLYVINLMQMEAVNAALEGIKALIGRCFINMQSYSQKNDEKAIKSFELRSLHAQKAGAELLNSEKAAATKRKKRNPQQILKEEVKPQSKQPQKNISPLKSSVKPVKPRINIPLKVQNETGEEKIVLKKKQTVTPFEKLPEVSVSLLKCEFLLKNLNDSPFVNEDCWQNNQIENLHFLLECLIETHGKEEFSADRIFEQTNLLRRSIEALLEIATIYTDSSEEEVQSIGHDTEGLLATLIKNTKIPENIKKLLWNMRNVPESFADANRCVNYPAEMDMQWKRLSEEGHQLLDFIIQVDREGNAEKKDEVLRTSLMVQQNRSLQRCTYFMERLLTALCDPSIMVDGDLPPMEYSQKVHEMNLANSESFTLERLTESQILAEEGIDLEKLKILSVNNREEALSAIDTALVWISIRCMAPVEGTHSFDFRKAERNIALRNCGISLRRLKEKLGPDRSNRPLSTILGQCELIRRAQKELSIAALYHTDSFIDGQHIVQAKDIRFANSPCFLMSILRRVSTLSKELPSVGNWMHRAHQILSYPASQEKYESDFQACQLQKLIQDVRQASRELRLVASDETLVLANSKHKSPNKRLQERNMLVTTNESERTFPGLAAFLHTLKFGLSLPKHKHLNV